MEKHYLLPYPHFSKFFQKHIYKTACGNISDGINDTTDLPSVQCAECKEFVAKLPIKVIKLEKQGP